MAYIAITDIGRAAEMAKSGTPSTKYRKDEYKSTSEDPLSNCKISNTAVAICAGLAFAGAVILYTAITCATDPKHCIFDPEPPGQLVVPSKTPTPTQTSTPFPPMIIPGMPTLHPAIQQQLTAGTPTQTQTPTSTQTQTPIPTYIPLPRYRRGLLDME